MCIRDRNRPGPSKWRARLTLTDGKRVHLGYHATELEAMQAVDRRAFEEWGDVSYTNAKLPLLSCVAPDADESDYSIPF